MLTQAPIAIVEAADNESGWEGNDEDAFRKDKGVGLRLNPGNMGEMLMKLNSLNTRSYMEYLDIVFMFRSTFLSKLDWEPKSRVRTRAPRELAVSCR